MLPPESDGQPSEAKASAARIPITFQDWFASRGWRPRDHQLALVAHAQKGESVLLVAPTGGGKTLAGFLPSLIDLGATHRRYLCRPAPAPALQPARHPAHNA